MAPHLTIESAAKALRAGEVTASELLDAALERADQLDSRLGVFLTRFTDSARESALQLDRRISGGYVPNGLDGIPIGIKNLIAERSGPTNAQSLVPSAVRLEGDAPVVARLRTAGAILVGKTTLAEYAHGAQDPEKPFPVMRNAWVPERSASGSSSGSASGLASGMFLGAIGTDTGGSIRIPSAFNGTTGLKPTYGRVPRTGVLPLSPTMDHVGPMARSAADCALLLELIAGADGADRSAPSRPVPRYRDWLTGDLTGVRVGYDDLDRHADGPIGVGIDPLQPERMANALGLLEEAGAEIVPIEIPMYKESLAAAWVIIRAESYAIHRARLRSNWNDYGRFARRAFVSGEVIDAADYIHAQRVRTLILRSVNELFSTVDLVATPTLHLGAPLLADIEAFRTDVPSSLHAHYWNPTGLPTLALPIGLSSEKTPLSLSLSGRAWDEGGVLQAGDAIQRRSTFHLEETPLLTLTKERV